MKIHIILIIIDLIAILINTAVLAYGDLPKFTTICGIPSGLASNIAFSIGVLYSALAIKTRGEHYESKV